MPIFGSFDILLPKAAYLEKWPVIACDQFTSQPSYWNTLRAEIGDAPSALHCIVPEAELSAADDSTYESTRKNMAAYLREGVFSEYPDSFVYVERTLHGGQIRRGVVGVLDLEAYDYRADTTAPVRATEKTVVERIPPRMRVRRNAVLDLSHVLLLCDDERREIIEPLSGEPAETVYEQELLQGGGHIRGRLIRDEAARRLRERIAGYCARKEGEPGGMVFAVGDGNHSLATAKECYEALKRGGADAEAVKRARYAVVELENIHDDAQQFEPIHRLVTGTNAEELLAYLQKTCCAADGCPIRWLSGRRQGTITLDRAKGILPVGILQNALDAYLAGHRGNIDYIHGEEALAELAKADDAVGFFLPDVPKDDFFRGIAKDGVLPRKTFSMGEASEKRYYFEARKL